jgi:hypothetical protein
LLVLSYFLLLLRLLLSFDQIIDLFSLCVRIKQWTIITIIIKFNNCVAFIRSAVDMTFLELDYVLLLFFKELALSFTQLEDFSLEVTL